MVSHPHFHTHLNFGATIIKWFCMFCLLIIVLDIHVTKKRNDILNLCTCDFKLWSYNGWLISAYNHTTPLTKSHSWGVERKITVRLNSLKMASGDAELRQSGKYCVIWHAGRSTRTLDNKVMTCNWWWSVVCCQCKNNNVSIIFSGTKFRKMRWEYCRIILYLIRWEKGMILFSNIIHVTIVTMNFRVLACIYTSNSRKTMLFPNLLRVVSD
jgi:hypothetical protein